MVRGGLTAHEIYYSHYIIIIIITVIIQKFKNDMTHSIVCIKYYFSYIMTNYKQKYLNIILKLVNDKHAPHFYLNNVEYKLSGIEKIMKHNDVRWSFQNR